MRYRRMGRTGWQVSEVSLGGGRWRSDGRPGQGGLPVRTSRAYSASEGKAADFMGNLPPDMREGRASTTFLVRF